MGNITEYIKEGASVITLALVIWVVVFQKRGIKTALFEIPPINPEELKISEFKGGGANEYVMFKKFEELSYIIKPEAEDARDKIKEKIIGYLIAFLRKEKFVIDNIRQSIFVSEIESYFDAIIDEKVYRYLFRSVLRKRRMTILKLFDIALKPIEKGWNNNSSLFKDFLDFCKIDMPIDHDIEVILNDFYEKVELEMSELIDSMHDEGHGFQESKLIASWRQVADFIFAVSGGR